MAAARRLTVLTLGVSLGVAGFVMTGEPSWPPGGASVRIGGEITVDSSLRLSRGRNGAPDAKLMDLTMRTARLRLQADVHPSVSALFKIDLQGRSGGPTSAEMVEEALLVMGASGGNGWSFYAGKGRAPYGQDITLGMIQSYHHLANRDVSPEGRVFLVEAPGDTAASIANPGRTIELPPMRPGQLDRVFLAGAAYEWEGRRRVEMAVFQPNRDAYAPRLRDGGGSGRHGSGTDIGAAARLWWRPVESLTLEGSAILSHSDDMGREWLRTDLPAGTEARKNAFALSLGFDWRREPWRIFGEYQHGTDWNFSRGHDSDAWQIGIARSWGSWRAGGMAESLRLSHVGKVDTYYKFTLNIRYAFPAGWFVMAEYGREWFRRSESGRQTTKSDGDFAGFRVGMVF
jgi:hypothetical protein